MIEWEPWFTFRAGIPPHELRELSLDQVWRHLDWWRTHIAPHERTALMAQHPALKR